MDVLWLPPLVLEVLVPSRGTISPEGFRGPRPRLSSTAYWLQFLWGWSSFVLPRSHLSPASSFRATGGLLEGVVTGLSRLSCGLGGGSGRRPDVHRDTLMLYTLGVLEILYGLHSIITSPLTSSMLHIWMH